MNTENEYRKQMEKIFKRVERVFENIDPDIAECETAMGAMTILLADQSKCILSAQPAVRQLWLALASRGTAYHFNYDASADIWMDDKGKGIELISFLETYLKEVTGIEIKI